MEKIKRTYERFMKMQEHLGLREVSAVAASTAFWFFLSLVPMVILAVSVLPYTTLSEEQLLHYMSFIIPGSMMELIAVIVADVYRSSLAILSLSVVATLWSAAKGFSSLLFGLEEVYKHAQRPSFLVRRAMGVGYTLGMYVFMLISILIGGFGKQLRRLAERFLPVLHGFFVWLLNFRFLVVIALLTVFFCAIYLRGSGRRLPVREVFPGAVLAAVGWSLLTWAFSAWITATRFGTYGSLATVIAVMLWMYWCMYILLLGACINRAIPKDRPLLSFRRKNKKKAEQTAPPAE